MNVAFITAQTGNLTVPCPEGQRVRIISAVVEMSALGADGDQLNIAFLRDQQNFVNVASNPLTGAMTRVSAHIGANGTVAMVSAIGAAGGPVVYNNNPVASMMALPDTWWPFEVIMTANFQLGTVTTFTVAYEVADQPQPKPKPKRGN